MNTTTIIIAVYGIACAAGCALFHRFIGDAIRTMRRPSEAERVTAARERVGMATEVAQADTRPGTDAAALDWLELTYNMPDFDAGAARLQAAIDDQHDTKGDQL